MPSTPSSQPKASSQPYPEASSTPKRNISAIDDDEYQKGVLCSQKRLKIIQDTLAGSSTGEYSTPTDSSQNSKLKPTVGIPSINYDNPLKNGGEESKSPPPSTPPRRPEPAARNDNENPFQDVSSALGEHDMTVRLFHPDISYCPSTILEIL